MVHNELENSVFIEFWINLKSKLIFAIYIVPFGFLLLNKSFWLCGEDSIEGIAVKQG